MRRRDQLIPAVAFVLLAAMGVLILALVTDAENSGRRALEDALLSEVQAIAQTQDAQVRSQYGSAGALGQEPWELVVGSEADEQRIEELLELLEGAGVRSGLFVTDASGLITQGENFTEDVIGQRLDRPGFEQFLEDTAAAPSGRGALLPVAAGVTTDLPTVGLVLPIPGAGGTFGTFVFEIEVAPDGAFNTDFAEYRRGDTGTLVVFDENGVVVASNDPSTLAAPVSDQLRARPAGLASVDGQVVALAEIQSARWKVAVLQDRDEFEEGLTGPLQRVGTIAVVGFLLVGVVSFIALSRRLRAAQEEQARLRRLNETQEEFISIVSHELRTPVAGVLGFLQTTIDHWDAMTDGERSAAVLRAASNARRLQGLTRDVLDSQSVESGRMTYAMNPGDLREEVSVAVDAARALYPTQRFEMAVEVGSAPARMDVDRIQQVLTNLIDNAVRISPPDEPVELRLWTDGDRACVSVIDHGPGLPPDLQGRVFEKFVRGRSGTVTGTGLGLYIARQILEAHEGSISVSSAAGEGASFTIELPLMTEPVAQ